MGFFDRLANLGKGVVSSWRREDRKGARASREALEEELHRLEAQRRSARPRSERIPEETPEESVDSPPEPTPIIEPDPETGRFPERKKTL